MFDYAFRYIDEVYIDIGKKTFGQEKQLKK